MSSGSCNTDSRYPEEIGKYCIPFAISKQDTANVGAVARFNPNPKEYSCHTLINLQCVCAQAER